MKESYLAKYARKNADEEFIKQLVKDVRQAERKHCASLYAVRLVKMSSHVLDNALSPSASADLMQRESENIEREAQEWSYV
ncbi:DUF2732 family protein [Xenorhabdus sp. SF857]|uniref:DUF2732 family protein n=1 Tax=Xenorhabdus bakwenae TaxID=3026967 RepID=UPI0025581625|nr:DUF2732 family protein [Xenorhabdus sp. SF857]WFQ78852.1 DUF2732 family protein [Xenorhabdus sp. SF857]WFQ80025.1 DUF2732 family protein [Xenorhabdus sp. SF857]WFQ80903.1 DUF2732 family protein [Xenorhabdus sp. SF857]